MGLLSAITEVYRQIRTPENENLNQYFNKVEELKSIIMVNGKHAVEVLFAHSDNFANGSNQASIRGGRFSTGLDQDLRDSFDINYHEILSAEMKARLLNETLDYLSVNTRQAELYDIMVKEVTNLEGLLHSRCPGI